MFSFCSMVTRVIVPASEETLLLLTTLLVKQGLAYININ